MNWLTKGEEELDNLPTQEHVHKSYRRYSDSDYPWKRVTSWIKSKVGQSFDKAVSEFVRLRWVPTRHRIASKLNEHIEVNTFMQNGKVCYYDRPEYAPWHPKAKEYKIVEERNEEVIYVHPETRLVCIHRKPKQKDDRAERRAELAKRVRILGNYHQLYKQNGIWYEVKAEVLPEGALGSYNRKGPHDILLEDKGGYYTYWNDKNPHVKIVLQRQISGKELRKHGLHNDPPETNPTVCPKCGGVKEVCIHHRMEQWRLRNNFI